MALFFMTSIRGRYPIFIIYSNFLMFPSSSLVKYTPEAN